MVESRKKKKAVAKSLENHYDRDRGQPGREGRRGQSDSSKAGGWVLPTFSLLSGLPGSQLRRNTSQVFHVVLVSVSDDPRS